MGAGGMWMSYNPMMDVAMMGILMNRHSYVHGPAYYDYAHGPPMHAAAVHGGHHGTVVVRRSYVGEIMGGIFLVLFIFIAIGMCTSRSRY
jgi:hypothetical protein